MTVSVVYYKQNFESLVIDNVSIGSQEFNQKYINNNTIGSVKFPNLISVDSYGLLSCFKGCTNLKSIEFTSLTELSKNNSCMFMCESCSQLTKISFPKLTSVDYFGLQQSFTRCYGLEEVTFPELQTIGYMSMANCFLLCSNLKTVRFPKLSTIGNDGLRKAFTNCTSLKEIHFPQALNNNSECTKDQLCTLDTCQILFDL